MKKFTVKTPSLLRDFTDAVYPQGSFYYSALLKSGDIRVNGVKVRSNLPLKAGDEVVYYTTPKMEQKPSHSLIYGGQSFVVCDKFSGVSTEALASELNLSPVHRLDRNTTGLIIFAKTKEAEGEFLRLFKEHKITKNYIAVCENNFKSPAADMTAYLYKDEKKGQVTISALPAKGYVPIRTGYRVLESRGELAMVRITLHTGKTHQIRAHMAYIGCPVLGDEKYGDAELNKKYSARRQQLNSNELAFSFDGRDYRFKSSLTPSYPPEK